MPRPIPYFEPDGSYNEREVTRTKPKSEFWLAFDLPLSKQLQGRISPQDGELLDKLSEARKLMVSHGILPGRRVRAVEKQIVLKAQRCMRRFSKT